MRSPAAVETQNAVLQVVSLKRFNEVTLSLFHPGDLSIGDWVRIAVMLLGFIGLPIFLIGFIIYKVSNRWGEAGETTFSKTDLSGDQDSKPRE